MVWLEGGIGRYATEGLGAGTGGRAGGFVDAGLLRPPATSMTCWRIMPSASVHGLTIWARWGRPPGWAAVPAYGPQSDIMSLVGCKKGL